jgi:hypothetical protein
MSVFSVTLRRVVTRYTQIYYTFDSIDTIEHMFCTASTHVQTTKSTCPCVHIGPGSLLLCVVRSLNITIHGRGLNITIHGAGPHLCHLYLRHLWLCGRIEGGLRVSWSSSSSWCKTDSRSRSHTAGDHQSHS